MGFADLPDTATNPKPKGSENREEGQGKVDDQCLLCLLL